MLISRRTLRVSLFHFNFYALADYSSIIDFAGNFLFKFLILKVFALRHKQDFHKISKNFCVNGISSFIACFYETFLGPLTLSLIEYNIEKWR